MSKEADDDGSGTDEISYTVERIVDDRVRGGQREYLLKWKGYSYSENTWEPEEHLNCVELLTQYQRQKMRHKGYGAKGIELKQVLRNVPDLHRIRVCNAVDNTLLPPDFTYTDDYIRREGVPLPSSVVFPCECEDECSANCDCMRVPFYDEHGRLCTALEFSLHECNHLCKCPPECPNRVVQRGRAIDIDIFRTPNKGWAARTRVPIVRGEYICRYTGELLTNQDADKRGGDAQTYLFDLDKEMPRNCETPFTIDARLYGNVSHFFNHSCDPNLAIWAVYINHLDPRLHELAFFAIRDIKPGEELTFDYSPHEAVATITETPHKFVCHCGASKCRGFVF
ncbi:hypothetical protein GGH91_001669 [Coemansia sp. RSA 2671]|nr:hypothetical protein LPJ60_001194 [Coemansia sp. RSA 2675]KAJ2347816.1 hypothetical protein GGH91_001669 [Coemansia sp. RSA 2671]